MPFDPEMFGQAMGQAIRAAVDPLVKRIEALEARGPEKGDKGDPGESVAGPKGDPGKDYDPAELTAIKADVSAIQRALFAPESIDKEFSARVSKALGETVLVGSK